MYHTKEEVEARGFIHLNIILTTAAAMWEMRKQAESLNIDVYDLRAFRREDGKWELYSIQNPGQYICRPILP